MIDKLQLILDNAKVELQTISTIYALEQLKSKYMGKEGIITAYMQQIKGIPPHLRKEFGAQVNEAKLAFEQLLNEQKNRLLELQIERQLLNEKIDVTASLKCKAIGSFHPVSLSLQRMVDIFVQLGFNVADGPEIESDYYNFKALNIPDNHPARAMQDTFYTENLSVLRTHTSPIQVRFAEKNKPPIKIIAPGRVYRVDMDATHSPMFHQLEGLWIDKNISFAHLKGIMIEFLRVFFDNSDLQIRFRASFFPFTEPSAEIDILSENGKWLEVAGCGMVHPNVLRYMNIDPNQYTGFAVGIGIDRFTMLRYQFNDLRVMFENDLDFLYQFRGKE